MSRDDYPEYEPVRAKLEDEVLAHYVSMANNDSSAAFIKSVEKGLKYGGWKSLSDRQWDWLANYIYNYNHKWTGTPITKTTIRFKGGLGLDTEKKELRI